jgi:hypothetical protein
MWAFYKLTVSSLRIAARGCLWSTILATACGYCDIGARAADTPVRVTTYHGDSLRTGWNARETVLTPWSVVMNGFKQQNAVTLDEQADTQPLYVAGQAINGQGVHNVVYVATENNTVYAIDGDTGAVLLSRNLGTPVPMSKLPGKCNQNSDVVGITATPVLNVGTEVMYVITYTLENNAPVYRLHKLALRSLADVDPSVIVSAGAKLTPTNATYKFNPAVSRSRAALLLANGNVYAAFGGFCGADAAITRGWVLGWNAVTLKPLANSLLLNQEATSTNNYFLTGVWMSGYGIAANAAGSLFFVTGNSDPAGTALHVPQSVPESMVKVSPDLSTVQSYFTPAGTGVDYKTLESKYLDFGAGGALVLPRQPGANPDIVVAAGKVGTMYVTNSDDLGGYNQGIAPFHDRIFSSYVVGSCYCGESYFTGSDGIGRVVSSGGNQALVWKIGVNPIPNLTLEAVSAPIPNGADRGFFTTISSNGGTANSQIVWAVGRPTALLSPAKVKLYAFNPSSYDRKGNMATLFSAPAGSWPTTGLANVVPTVANGHVYVASYKKLTIFGISGSDAPGALSQVGFTASSSLLRGLGAHVNVFVDGKFIADTYVGTQTATYSFATSKLAPNVAHLIQLQYNNDLVIPGQDRNLYLTSITVDKQVFLARGKYEVYQSVSHGTFPSRGAIYWNGVVNFNLPASLFPGEVKAASLPGQGQ